MSLLLMIFVLEQKGGFFSSYIFDYCRTDLTISERFH